MAAEQDLAPGGLHGPLEIAGEDDSLAANERSAIDLGPRPHLQVLTHAEEVSLDLARDVRIARQESHVVADQAHDHQFLRKNVHVLRHRAAN